MYLVYNRTYRMGIIGGIHIICRGSVLCVLVWWGHRYLCTYFFSTTPRYFVLVAIDVSALWRP